MRSAVRGLGGAMMGLLAMSGATTVAPLWAEEAFPDPSVYYAITYALNDDHTETLRSVKVVGVTKIGAKAFLVVDTGGPQKALGYLELESIRSILPMSGTFPIERKP